MIGAITAGMLSGGVAASTNSYESIATAIGTGSSGTITFSSIPSTYKHLQIRAAILTTTGGGSPYIQFNSDTGANYFNHFLYGTGTTATAGANPSTSNLYYGGANNGTTASHPYVAVIDILDYQNTNKYKTVRVLSGFDSNGAAGQEVGLYSGAWANTAAINSISLSINKNYSTTTVFALYGIKG